MNTINALQHFDSSFEIGSINTSLGKQTLQARLLSKLPPSFSKLHRLPGTNKKNAQVFYAVWDLVNFP